MYYGLSLGVASLGVNIYIAFAISSAVEIPGDVLIVYPIEYWGRRPPYVLIMLISGIACLVTTTIRKFLCQLHSIIFHLRWLAYGLVYYNIKKWWRRTIVACFIALQMANSINKGANLWHFWCPCYIWNSHLFMAPGEDANSGVRF